jgi:hypothetical protein
MKLILRYSDDNATRIQAAILTFPYKYIFRREHVSKEPLEVWLYPQEVSLFGKGANIKIRHRVQPYQCAALFGGAPLFEDDTAYIHVGSDGCYYPSCGCPYDKSLCLGKVGVTSLFDALKSLANFEFKVLRAIRPRKSEFYEKIPCQECIRLAVK